MSNRREGREKVFGITDNLHVWHADLRKAANMCTQLESRLQVPGHIFSFVIWKENKAWYTPVYSTVTRRDSPVGQEWGEGIAERRG